MSIEKHVSLTWQVENVLDSPSKVACWQAPTYVPPEIQSFMNRLKERGADPRFTYVHIVAMTDGDYYGQNLNGDVFSTDELTGMQSEQEAAKNRGDMCGVAVPRYKVEFAPKCTRDCHVCSVIRSILAHYTHRLCIMQQRLFTPRRATLSKALQLVPRR